MAAPLLLGAVVVVSACSVLIGARAVPFAALTDADHPLRAIYEARIPRTLLGLAVGAALGLAGACMQGLTRNPLADPGLLGIHAGATTAMVVSLTFLEVRGIGGQLWFAFAGAGLAAALVHALGSLGPGTRTPARLVVAGAAVTAALTSFTSAVLLADRSTLEEFRFWSVGNVAGRGYEPLVTVLPFLVIGAAIALTYASKLDALALGDDVARSLGNRPGRDRLIIGIAIVLLCGAATAAAGPIVFVGLMVPHAVRIFTGNAHGSLLPYCALAGAALAVSADIVGRLVLPPTEVQVGIMCSVIGVPVFLVLLGRGRLGAL